VQLCQRACACARHLPFLLTCMRARCCVILPPSGKAGCCPAQYTCWRCKGWGCKAADIHVCGQGAWQLVMMQHCKRMNPLTHVIPGDTQPANALLHSAGVETLCASKLGARFTPF
jgi:hypothetical protein